MTTTLSKRYQPQPDAYYGREQTEKRRIERRSAVMSLLDVEDRPKAYGMPANVIAERAGLPKQSVAQTLGALLREGIVIKKSDRSHNGRSLYFLRSSRATRRAESAEAQAAIALYRAEKQRRIDRRKALLDEAKQDLERLERNLDAVSKEKRQRGAQRAGETTQRKARERKQAQHATS